MKTFIALALTTLSLALSVPAHADDEAFYESLRDYGINMDTSVATQQAKLICDYLATPGDTILDAGKTLVKVHTDWDMTDAAHFIGAATANYCPGEMQA